MPFPPLLDSPSPCFPAAPFLVLLPPDWPFPFLGGCWPDPFLGSDFEPSGSVALFLPLFGAVLSSLGGAEFFGLVDFESGREPPFLGSAFQSCFPSAEGMSGFCAEPPDFLAPDLSLREFGSLESDGLRDCCGFDGSDFGEDP